MASLCGAGQDLRIAGRGLARQPASSLMTVGILTLGIAGTATVFNLVNRLSLRPLPVPGQERLVDLNEAAPQSGPEYVGLSYPHFHAWRRYNKTFECMAVRTMSQRVDQSTLLRRLCTRLLVVPAGAAALMACAGIYGVISYWAGQRTREIGIRRAFGARAFDVAVMVMRQGLRLILLGAGLGLFGACVLAHLLASVGNLLYHVSPTDPLTFIGVSGLLIIVAVRACYLPARRAAHVDSIAALRYE
jgi:hypothetical protein